MAQVTAFSGHQVNLTLMFRERGGEARGQKIRGFAGASDAIKFEEAQEVVNAREGMDGYVFFSQTGRRGGMMTIKLLPNSPSMAMLFTQHYRQKNGFNNEWSGEIELLEQGVKADLLRGMCTHGPTFPTVGMNNIDDLQFSFYFTEIDVNVDQADFDVFAPDLTDVFTTPT